MTSEVCSYEVGAAPEWARAAALPVVAAAPPRSAVAVALRHGDRRAVVTHGRTAHEGGVPVTADTRFEAGSLTKCFTALLLAEQAARGEVSYGDPLSRFLPPDALPPAHGASPALLHLATHTAGLPRLPPGMLTGAAARWFSNPYAEFTTADLLRALARTRLRTPPGSRVRYSNFGVGLLGHLLTRAAPSRPEYGALLADRVLTPLGLARTTCAPDAAQATGYWHGRPREPWQIHGLAGAGAVRSSARDLLTLLDVLADASQESPGHCEATGTESTPLRAALVDATRPRLALPGGTRRMALVWNIRVRPGGEVYHHSGGTRGFTAFAGFGPRDRTAVVALANTQPSADQRFIQSAYNALLSLPASGETEPTGDPINRAR
ncbi:serine hydrolase domain-containing protein [Streptomyces sp. NPDC088725]|uniref:serine hydrolase domain-containing protein n=1 Tax=Streptomyces sp. NPDC088725 TaxID=3365873 RepID=UPI00382E0AA8